MYLLLYRFRCRDNDLTTCRLGEIGFPTRRFYYNFPPKWERTFCLGSKHSTTELRPLYLVDVTLRSCLCQRSHLSVNDRVVRLGSSHPFVVISHSCSSTGPVSHRSWASCLPGGISTPSPSANRVMKLKTQVIRTTDRICSSLIY